MATATEAKYSGAVISVNLALSVRDSAKAERRQTPEFRCIECDGLVRPHRGGGHASAHFEHRQRNLACTLSHKERHHRANMDAPKARYADQFSDKSLIDHSARQRTATGTVFIRKEGVRLNALARSEGLCEYCSAPGFSTTDGRTYLETHHIEPLSEGGADSIQNVIAVCPNHHREAHSGVQRTKMRSEMKRIVQERNASKMGD